MSKIFYDLLKSNKFFTYKDTDKILQSVEKYIEWKNKYDVKEKINIKYANIPIAFDTETTSFYDHGEKRACMYVWMLCIYGITIVGRTWQEFLLCIDKIVNYFECDHEKRLVIYVHNLGYDFSFFYPYFKWTAVFANAPVKPIYALTDRGIEFRCSYFLAGCGLETVGKNLTRYKMRKQVGLLNYNLKRHSKTPLSMQEMKYCVYDVKVLSAFIMESIENDGDITRIPLTKTGYVRRFCRERCFYEPGKSRKKSIKKMRYREFISKLSINSVEEYELLRQAFSGGFVHGSLWYIDETINEEMGSSDICSSYPTEMVSEMFPMSRGEQIEIKSKKQFFENLKNYCCVFQIELHNVRQKFIYDGYISESKCLAKENVKSYNGRILSADKIVISVTNVDFDIISKFYYFDENIKIGLFYRYEKGYLPKDLVLAILELYKNKTELKDVPEKIVEYFVSKGMLNSCYGNMVQDVIQSNIIFENGVYTDEQRAYTYEQKWEQIKLYNENPNRYLFYPWGVFVTAYARKKITTAILHLQSDYGYSDTDSVKYKNVEKHKQFFNDMNKFIQEKIEKALNFYHIPLEMARPKTIKGKEKPLGVFEIDGEYETFKYLGAKRYMYRDKYDHTLHITVAGLNKEITKNYLEHKYKNKVFDKFTDGLRIRADRTGKKTHTYINKEIQGYLKDYTGKIGEYHEKSFVHLEPAPYVLGIDNGFMDYIIDKA